MKRHIIRAADTVRAVKNRHLFVLLIVFLLISAAALRQNNVQMGELRDDVITADESGENVDEALLELQNHIFSHMNTGMSQPLNLVSSFNRAVEDARAEAEQTGSNPEVYRDAQAVCENPGVVLSVRAQCIQDYVVENAPEGVDPTELEIPPKELYIYDYQSPRWSPDVAGWSIVISTVLGLSLLYRTVKKQFSA